MFRERIVEWANLIGFLVSMVGMMVVQSRDTLPSRARLSSGNAVIAQRMSVNAQREIAMAQVRMGSINR
jgi:hypothetical protein